MGLMGRQGEVWGAENRLCEPALWPGMGRMMTDTLRADTWVQVLSGAGVRSPLPQPLEASSTPYQTGRNSLVIHCPPASVPTGIQRMAPADGLQPHRVRVGGGCEGERDPCTTAPAMQCGSTGMQTPPPCQAQGAVVARCQPARSLCWA